MGEHDPPYSAVLDYSVLYGKTHEKDVLRWNIIRETKSEIFENSRYEIS